MGEFLVRLRELPLSDVRGGNPLLRFSCQHSRARDASLCGRSWCPFPVHSLSGHVLLGFKPPEYASFLRVPVEQERGLDQRPRQR